MYQKRGGWFYRSANGQLHKFPNKMLADVAYATEFELVDDVESESSESDEADTIDDSNS